MRLIPLIIISLSFWAVSSLSAQNVLFVSDSSLKTPLFGAHVRIIPSDGGKTYYGITDANGSFKFNCKGYCRLEISHLGYKSVSDTIKARETLKISLIPNNSILKQVEVVSNFVPQGEDAVVQKVQVIDRERIDKQGAVNLRDLLSNDLNIRLSQDNFLGSAMSMQGVGGENVKIMIDGVPVIGRLNGNIDLSQINLNTIERVEIIQGPASVTYGTNALGGIINLITKKKTKPGYEASINTYYETVGNYNADGSFAYSKNKHSIRVSGGRYFFDGFNPENFGRYQQWKPKRQYFSDLQYSIKYKEITFRINGAYYNEKIQNKGIPISPFNVTAIDEYYNTTRYNAGITISGFVKPKRHIDITSSFSGFDRTTNQYLKDLTTLNMNLVASNTDRFLMGMSRGIYTYRSASEKLMVQTGYDVHVESGSGPRIQNGSQWMGDFAAFLLAEYTAWKKLTFRPGLRYGYNTKYKAPVIPSISLKADIHKYFTLRGTYSRGFRAPDLKELFFEFIDINHHVLGNPNLKAENSDNFLLQGTFKINKKDYAFTLEPSGFYNDIRNRISLVFTGNNVNNGPPIYENRNVGRFRSTGGQLNLGFTWKNLQLNTGFAYTGINAGLPQGASGTDKFLFTPEIRTNLSYSFSKIGLNVSAFTKYTGKQPFLYLNNSELAQGYIGSFTTIDLSVTKSFFKKSLQISLYGKNLMNVTNVFQNGSPSSGFHQNSSGAATTAWGRTFAVSVRYLFTK